MRKSIQQMDSHFCEAKASFGFTKMAVHQLNTTLEDDQYHNALLQYILRRGALLSLVRPASTSSADKIWFDPSWTRFWTPHRKGRPIRIRGWDSGTSFRLESMGSSLFDLSSWYGYFCAIGSEEAGTLEADGIFGALSIFFCGDGMLDAEGTFWIGEFGSVVLLVM